MLTQKPSTGTTSASKNKAFTPSKYPKGRRDIEPLNLSMEAQMVLLHLIDISDRYGQSFPSNKEIAESCFRNGKRKDYQPETLERMVKPAINELIEAGVLQVHQRKREDGGNYTNLYQLVSIDEWPPITEEHVERLPWPIARRVRRRLGQVAQAVGQAAGAVKQALKTNLYNSRDRGVHDSRGRGYATAPHNFIISNLDLREENNKADFEPNPRGEIFEFEWGEEAANSTGVEALNLDQEAERLEALMNARRSEPKSERVSHLDTLDEFWPLSESEPIQQVNWDEVAKQNEAWMQAEMAKATALVNSSAFFDPEIKPEENHKSEQYTPVIEAQPQQHFAQEPLHNAQDQDRARGFSAEVENNKPKTTPTGKPMPRLCRGFAQSGQHSSSRSKPKPVLRVPGFRPRFIGEILRCLPLIKGYVMLPREKLYTLPRFIAVRLCQYWLIERIIGYPPFAEDEDGNLLYDGRQVMLDLEEAMADHDIEFGPEDDILAPDCPLTLRLLRDWAVAHKKTNRAKFNKMLEGFFVKAQEFLKQGGSYFEFLEKPLLTLPGLAD